MGLMYGLNSRITFLQQYVGDSERSNVSRCFPYCPRDNVSDIESARSSVRPELSKRGSEDSDSGGRRDRGHCPGMSDIPFVTDEAEK